MAENEDDSILGTGVTTRQVEAFGRKVTATANHLIGETTSSAAYQQAMTNIHRGMRRPGLQRSVFSMTRASPRETLRAKLSTSEIQHRALSYIPDELLTNLPADEDSSYSLFQGFKATIPESEDEEEEGDDGGDGTGQSRRKSRRSSRMQRLLKARGEGDGDGGGGVGSQRLRRVKREQGRANHRLEMLGVRKNMASAEILEIDKKIANLHSMRKIVLDRLADLEDDELKLEQEIAEIDIKVEDLQVIADEEEATSKAQAAAAATAAAAAGTAAITTAAAASTSQAKSGVSAATAGDEEEEEDGDTTPGAVTPATTEGGSTGDGFMSASIYGKLPDSSSSSKVRRQKLRKRKSMPIRHGHFEPGTSLMEIPAHNDIVTSLDFDAPFGTMVTAALDDTLRVWDLNSGRCLGLLEGHRASVRCVQVEDTMVATGSIDASVRLWDLSRIDAPPLPPSAPTEEEENEDDVTTPLSSEIYEPVPSSAATAECEVFSLEAHVAEITALHFRGDTLVSGSADKTLRQWDLVKGRCVQTLDVLWAAAQASATAPDSGGSGSKASNLSSTSTNPSSSSSFSFSNSSTGAGGGGHWRTTSRLPDANADFVGALQCFDAALACGTADGMVRLWDLRSGQVSRQLVGHTGPVTCLQFDDMHLVTGSLDRSIRVWDLRTGSIFDAFAYVNPVTSMMFDARRIVAAAGESTVKVYDKADGRQWDCGGEANASVVERARIRDGFLVEGRRDGVVGVWSC